MEGTWFAFISCQKKYSSRGSYHTIRVSGLSRAGIIHTNFRLLSEEDSQSLEVKASGLLDIRRNYISATKHCSTSGIKNGFRSDLRTYTW